MNDLDARKLAILADCHIHSGGGPDWSPAVFDALAAVDLIVTLGDMGEAAGLDRLAAIAPVIGVRGADDEDDVRTACSLRALRLGAVWIGCVFDAVAQGLATSSEPFSPSDGWTQKAKGLFGEPVQVLLCASTHRPSVVELDGILVVNPGSAVLPADGAGPSFALLTIEDEKVEVKIVPLDA